MQLLSLFCLVVLCTSPIHGKGKGKEPEEKAAAGCTLSMTNSISGTIASPGYTSPYTMKNCVRIITAPTGKKITLTLVDIDTYKKGSSCNRKSDKILVSDKPDSSYDVVRTWCGDALPSDKTFTSTKNVVKVFFKTHKVSSSYTNSHKGFKISFNYVGGDNSDTATSSTTTASTTTSSSTTESGGSASCGQSKYSSAGDKKKKKKKRSTKIVGGKETEPYEYPWLAAFINVESDKQFCGGSILNKRWILTAAHCVKNYVSSPSAIQAAIHVDNIDTRAGAQIMTISQVIIHGNYNSPTQYNNDIALVKVNQDITYSADIQPVCLPEANNLYTGRSAIIAGWGRTVSGGAPSFVLLEAKMTIPTNAACNTMMESEISNPLSVNDNMMCSTDGEGNTSKDTCQGDSGGPMTVKESDDRFHIIGVTSWGYGCASGTPGVYTRISRYLSWINARIT